VEKVSPEENQDEPADDGAELDQSINIQERVLLPPSVTPRAFQLVLEYVYQADLVTRGLHDPYERTTSADWISLCSLIKQFDLPPPSAIDSVLNFLAGTLERSTLFACIRLAQEHNHSGLNDACLKYFAQHYHSVRVFASSLARSLVLLLVDRSLMILLLSRTQFSAEELDSLPSDVLEIFRTHMEFGDVPLPVPQPEPVVPQPEPPMHTPERTPGPRILNPDMHVVHLGPAPANPHGRNQKHCALQ